MIGSCIVLQTLGEVEPPVASLGEDRRATGHDGKEQQAKGQPAL
jgi:hypothetical protein